MPTNHLNNVILPIDVVVPSNKIMQNSDDNSSKIKIKYDGNTVKSYGMKTVSKFLIRKKRKIYLNSGIHEVEIKNSNSSHKVPKFMTAQTTTAYWPFSHNYHRNFSNNNIAGDKIPQTAALKAEYKTINSSSNNTKNKSIHNTSLIDTDMIATVSTSLSSSSSSSPPQHQYEPLTASTDTIVLYPSMQITNASSTSTSIMVVDSQNKNNINSSGNKTKVHHHNPPGHSGVAPTLPTTTTTTHHTNRNSIYVGATAIITNGKRPTIIIYPTVSPESIVIPIVSCILGFPLLALMVICCLRRRAKLARERDRRRNYDMQDHAVSLVRFSPIHRLNNRSTRVISLRPERSLSRGFPSLELDTVIEERSSDHEQTQTDIISPESPLDPQNRYRDFNSS